MASGKARQRDGVAYARTLYCGTITPISTANAPPRGIKAPGRAFWVPLWGEGDDGEVIAAGYLEA
jgi:hypothetical protein